MRMHAKNSSNSNDPPFLLARHGQSVLNAGEKMQGRAQGRGDVPGNGLTDKGKEQARSMYPALRAAEVTVLYVSSSRLLRAQQTATAFIDSHPHLMAVIRNEHVPNLEEVSQEGWEMKFTREEVMKLRQDSLAKETERLILEGLDHDLKGYVAWIAMLGKSGESPLGAALRGIKALEDYGVRPGELVISHSMLNRYMDAIATRVDRAGRSKLLEMNSGTLETAGKIALLKTLKELDLSTYNVDDSCNKVANGGITEYTIDHATGLWIAGRRIEPSKPPETLPFIEHRRGADGMWTRLTPIKG